MSFISADPATVAEPKFPGSAPPCRSSSEARCGHRFTGSAGPNGHARPSEGGVQVKGRRYSLRRQSQGPRPTSCPHSTRQWRAA